MTAGTARPGLLRRVFATMGNPRVVMATYVEDVAWPVALTVPLLAFALFFLQSGIDLYRDGALDGVEVAGLAFGGAVMGLVLVPLLALVAWVVSQIFDTKRSAGWAVRAFSLAYAPALVYGVCGLVMSLFFGWNTAVAFGITGVLWAISPLFAALREMSGDRRRLSLVLASLVGLIVLVVWSAAVGG